MSLVRDSIFICSLWQDISCRGAAFLQIPFHRWDREFVKAIHSISWKTEAVKAHREPKLKRDGFIDSFFKFDAWSFLVSCAVTVRFFANHVTGAIDSIYTNVHHWTTTSQLFIQSPLGGIAYPETSKSLENKGLPSSPSFLIRMISSVFWL